MNKHFLINCVITLITLTTIYCQLSTGSPKMRLNLIFFFTFLTFNCENQKINDRNTSLWTQSTIGSSVDPKLFNVSIDPKLSIFKSDLFFVSIKWPYLSPIGPSGRFICFCPPTRPQVVVRPATSSKSFGFIFQTKKTYQWIDL